MRWRRRRPSRLGIGQSNRTRVSRSYGPPCSSAVPPGWAACCAWCARAGCDHSAVSMRAMTRRAVRTPIPDTRRSRSHSSHEVEASSAPRYSLRAVGASSVSSGAKVARRLSRSRVSAAATACAMSGEEGARRARARRTGEISSNSAARWATVRSILDASERRGDSRGIPVHWRRSCSAATKWYRSSMSAKWWNTSRSDTPARAATALAVGSGSPERRSATSASATLRRVRRPRARRPSVASSPASAATSRSTRSSSCSQGIRQCEVEAAKAPVACSAGRLRGAWSHWISLSCQWGNPTPNGILRTACGPHCSRVPTTAHRLRHGAGSRHSAARIARGHGARFVPERPATDGWHWEHPGRGPRSCSHRGRPGRRGERRVCPPRARLTPPPHGPPRGSA